MVDYFKYVTEMEEQSIRLSQECFSQDLQRYKLAVNVLTQMLNMIDKAFSVAESKYLKLESKIATIQNLPRGKFLTHQGTSTSIEDVPYFKSPIKPQEYVEPEKPKK